MRGTCPIILGILLAAGGCKSDSEVAAAPPDEVFTSTKSAGEVASCLGGAAFSEMTTRMREDGAIIVKQVSERGNAGAAFTVIPVGTGSRIELRQPAFAGMTGHRDCY